MKNKGQVINFVIIILLFFTISIIAYVFFLSTETRWTIKEKKTTTAFNIAQAGIERAVWKLNSTYRGWESAARGSVPDGYDGDKIYEKKINGVTVGYYKIKISSEDLDTVIIHSVGKDVTHKQLRGIKVVYKSEIIETSVKSSDEMEIKGNAEVHWGPIASISEDLELSGDAVNKYYPRKYAGLGFIVDPRDPNGAGEIPDSGPSNLPEEYREWHSNYPLEETIVDLNKYKQRAIAYRTPQPIDGSSPPGSGYFPGEERITIPTGYEDTCSTATYYIEGDCRIQPNVFIGPADGTITDNQVALICLGNIELRGTGKFDNYAVRVPKDAWKEYQVIDTSAAGEYPGDLGYQNSGDGTNTVLLDNVKFNGFMYVQGDVYTAAANQVVVGVMLVKGEVDSLKGEFQIYYNRHTAENVIYSQSPWKQKSWEEFLVGSWDNPNW